MEQKVFDVDNLINEIYNEFSWVFADNIKYIKLVNIILKQKNTNELQEENERLKTELAEKDKQLQNAIVPKFEYDEECVVIFMGSYYFHRYIAPIDNKRSITQPYNDIEEHCYIDNEDIFATKSEAEEALKKIGGK